MSRPSTVSTVRGTKRATTARLSALFGQWGAHGVEVVEHVQEKRGVWRLSFRLTPDREMRRQINLKLKASRQVFEPSESQRAILAAMLGGAGADISFWNVLDLFMQGRADIEILIHHRLIRKAGEVYKLTPKGRRLVLRRLGGNE